jgi:hypothetical protein
LQSVSVCLRFWRLLYSNRDRKVALMTIRHLTALLAIFAVLVVMTASVLPGHSHDSDTARPCDICHSGHLPCLESSAQVQFHTQMPVVWQNTPDDFEWYLGSACVIRSPRAPPV